MVAPPAEQEEEGLVVAVVARAVAATRDPMRSWEPAVALQRQHQTKE